MCFDNSLMKETQNLRISLSDFPLGSKSAPPLPPPMFTENDNRSALAVFLAYPPGYLGVLTAGESILKDLLKAQELEDRQIHCRVESEPSLIGP